MMDDESPLSLSSLPPTGEPPRPRNLRAVDWEITTGGIETVEVVLIKNGEGEVKEREGAFHDQG